MHLWRGLVVTAIGSLIAFAGSASAAEKPIPVNPVKLCALYAQPFVDRHGRSSIIGVHDPELFERLVRVLTRGRTSHKRPKRRADWRIMVLDSKGTREYSLWSREGLVAHSEDPHAVADIGVEGAIRLIASLKPLPVPPTVHPKATTAQAFTTGSEYDDLRDSVQMSMAVCVVQVVDLLGSYHPSGISSLQETTYVVRVLEHLKNKSSMPILMRIRWPGGYLDGGQTRGVRLLNAGDRLILFLVRNRARDGRGPIGSPLDWVVTDPTGCLFIENGITHSVLLSNGTEAPEKRLRFHSYENLFMLPVDRVLARIREAVAEYQQGGPIDGVLDRVRRERWRSEYRERFGE